MKTISKKSFLARLARCTKGDIAEKLVVVGLFVTAAALAGNKMIDGAQKGGTSAATRVTSGANGNAPTPQ